MRYIKLKPTSIDELMLDDENFILNIRVYYYILDFYKFQKVEENKLKKELMHLFGSIDNVLPIFTYVESQY